MGHFLLSDKKGKAAGRLTRGIEAPSGLTYEQLKANKLSKEEVIESAIYCWYTAIKCIYDMILTPANALLHCYSVCWLEEKRFIIHDRLGLLADIVPQRMDLTQRFFYSACCTQYDLAVVSQILQEVGNDSSGSVLIKLGVNNSATEW